MTTKIKAGVIGDNVVGITQLNVSDGTNGQFLKTDGSGTLAFDDAASAFADLTDVTVSTSDPAVNTNPSTGVGTLWLNKSSGDLYVCTSATTNDNFWTNIGKGDTNVGFSATGGTITTSGNYTIHTFTSSGTFQVTAGSKNIEVLVVAGGGGGGGDNSGAGGAGGLIYYGSESP